MDPHLPPEDRQLVGRHAAAHGLSGEPEVPRRNADAENTRGVARQNEAAVTLSEHGLNIEQLPNSNRRNERSPDLRINGEFADVYSPRGSNVLSVWQEVEEKVSPQGGRAQQAPNIVINLADSSLSASDIAQYFQRNPMPRLQSLIIIGRDGRVTVLRGQ